MNFVMRFPEGKPKALTFSYDDGVYQDVRLMELFDRYGLKATFNLNSALFSEDGGQRTAGRMTKEDALKLFSSSAHEVAVHSCTHPHLDWISTDHVVKEILKDRERLEELFGRIIRGGAYPFGTYTDAVVQALQNCGIGYFRTTHSTESFAIPTDWLRLAATCHHKNPRLMELAQQFISQSPNHNTGWRRNPWLFYVWGHSYEFDQEEPFNNWTMMETFCGTVAQQQDVWYATNQEIYDYIQAYRQMQVSLNEQIVHNPTAHTLYFEYKQTLHQLLPGQTKVMESL